MGGFSRRDSRDDLEQSKKRHRLSLYGKPFIDFESRFNTYQ